MFGCDGSELLFWCILLHCQDERVAPHHAVFQNGLPHYLYSINIYIYICMCFGYVCVCVGSMSHQFAISHILCFELILLYLN